MKNVGEFKFEYEHAEQFLEPNLSTLDVLEENRKKVDAIPINVFSEKLSPLMSAVKYLHDNKNMGFSKISKLLNRDQRTIWTEYNYSKDKPSFSEEKLNSSRFYIPFVVLKKRDLSFLESICSYMKSQGFSNKEMSLILNKDPKTIWTVLNRAKNKSGGVAK